MKSKKVAIVGTRYANFSIEEQVFSELGVTIVSGPGKDSEDIAEIAGDAEIVLAGAAPKFDRQTLEKLACRGIIRYGVGTESVDLLAAKDLGIWVSRVADYGTEAVATHSVALALTAIRGIRDADQIVQKGLWGFAELKPLHLPSALTVGVVGTGRIGLHAAKQFLGLGFNVITYDITPPKQLEAGIELVASLNQLLLQSDIVSLHVPGSANGSPLMGQSEFALMKLGSIIINTSRGSLIDTSALIAALKSGHLKTAALDVFEREPVQFSEFHEVASKMIFTPHMAWYTEESEIDLRFKAALEARRLLSGERPLEIVVEPSPEKARARL
jgi:D-3-phosphoglycerate dehydrogenase